MMNTIAHLHDHVIVCGGGTTGQHVIAELIATGTPYVVIDLHEDSVKRLSETLNAEIPFLLGDATDEDVLVRAGLAKAQGLIAVLTDDRDNLMVTITARSQNERARIVAKAVQQESSSKLIRAGATSVVSPARIGGMRMVSEIVRPTVVKFLDEMLRDRDANRRIEEIKVSRGSRLLGKTLGQADLRAQTESHVIAVRRADGTYLFNPGPDHVFEPETTLLVVVRTSQLAALRSLFAGP